MKKFSLLLVSLITLSLFAQNESLFNGLNFSAFYVNTTSPFTGVDDVVSDGVGNGTFTGGTFTYTIDAAYNFTFVEDFGTETHTYIGAAEPGGEYTLLIPDPSEIGDQFGIVSTMKLGSGKTNASFIGEYITSYYRYDSPIDHFMGLFLVTADGVDTCTYHQLMGTAPAGDEDFTYAVDAEGRITLRNGSNAHVISAAINAEDNVYTYASVMNGFPAYGNGVEKLDDIPLSTLQGEYRIAQIRYSNDYGEESSSLLTIHLNADGTGTYAVDSNSHGERTTGTLTVAYTNNGIWEIELDNSSDYTIYGTINPTERIITGYFNFGGVDPGIIYGINKIGPPTTYTISGTVSGADEVLIGLSGDAEGSQTINAGETFSFTVDHGQSVVLTPVKEGHSFVPESIKLDEVTDDMVGQDFVATAHINGLNDSEGQRIKIYPNPVHGVLSIETPGDCSIVLVDLSGKVLHTLQSTEASIQTIALHELKAGIYLLKISGAMGNVIEKIIIE